MFVILFFLFHSVKLLSGPSLAILNVISWAKWVLLSGPSLFLAYFYRGFKRFLHTQLSSCVSSWGASSDKFSKNNVSFYIFIGCILFKHPSFQLTFGKIFSTLLKHYKSRGFNILYVFCFSKRRNWQNKKANWNF